MTDRIETIVGKAILYTQEILNVGAANWSIARGGLTKMAVNLERAAPGHPALEALRRFIEENDALYGGADVRH